MNESAQGELVLPAPPAREDEPLAPARMVNEWVYCPRLAYIEWLEGEWAETGDRAAGRRAHARVEAGAPPLPSPERGSPPPTARRALRRRTSSPQRSHYAKLRTALLFDRVHRN